MCIPGKLTQKWKSAAASLALFVLFAVPFGICLPFVFAVPSGTAPEWQFVVDVERVPVDGTPLAVEFRGVWMDAWQRRECLPRKLYVMRGEDNGVNVLPAEHHERLRIPVVFCPDEKLFRSVCWDTTFDLSGRCRDSGDEACGMPRLETHVVDGSVLVRLWGRLSSSPQ